MEGVEKSTKRVAVNSGKGEMQCCREENGDKWEGGSGTVSQTCVVKNVRDNWWNWIGLVDKVGGEENELSLKFHRGKEMHKEKTNNVREAHK